MEYSREIAEKALECCGDKNNCEGCPLKGECESNPFESVIAKYAANLVKDLKADLAELEEFVKDTAETQNHMTNVIENLATERDVFREAMNSYKNYVDNFGNYLSAGYEPSAAKYAAEMDMWRVITLDRQALEEELERLSAENLELRSKSDV